MPGPWAPSFLWVAMSPRPVWVRDHIKKRKTATGTRRNETDTPLPGGWGQLRNVTIYLGVKEASPPFPGIDTILKSSRTKRTRQSDQHEPALPWPRIYRTHIQKKLPSPPEVLPRGRADWGPTPSSIGQLYHNPAMNHWRQSLASWELDG